MAYGVIEYDDEGNPKCEICGKHYKRVISHTRQAHGVGEDEYKNRFGFDSKKGICSKESSEKTRLKTLSNYEKCINKNLLVKGIKTRKKKGDIGRTKDMVSEQTRLMLKDRLKQPYMIKAMKLSGSVVGKSGLGNIKRWKKP